MRLSASSALMVEYDPAGVSYAWYASLGHVHSAGHNGWVIAAAESGAHVVNTTVLSAYTISAASTRT
eukprot:352932-Chlamydomonas_euryale.AAC.14